MSRTRKPLQGTILAFDAERGMGSLRTDGGDEVFFHCTAIADGSRNIASGRRVVCVLGPGHLGRLEARDITPLEKT